MFFCLTRNPLEGKGRSARKEELTAICVPNAHKNVTVMTPHIHLRLHGLLPDSVTFSFIFFACHFAGNGLRDFISIVYNIQGTTVLNTGRLQFFGTQRFGNYLFPSSFG
jgi:hypothetical protein